MAINASNLNRNGFSETVQPDPISDINGIRFNLIIFRHKGSFLITSTDEAEGRRGDRREEEGGYGH